MLNDNSEFMGRGVEPWGRGVVKKEEKLGSGFIWGGGGGGAGIFDSVVN